MTPPRRLRLGFVLPGLVFVALVSWLAFGGHKPAKTARNPTVAVAVAKVAVQDFPVAVTSLGAAQAWQGVVIRAQVSGVLKRVEFHEGTDVRAGQVLARIDARPFEAVLMQAKGALTRDQALLAAARIDLARYQTLAAQDSISRQQVDTQTALVKQDEGVVMIDQGAVAAAEVNVRYCRIVSPVSGRIGVRLVDPGNVVSPADATGIATVNQLSPIAVTFTIPQGDFQRLSDASEGFRRPMVTLALSQDTGAVLGEGELSIADNHVDPATGSVAMKARFPNAGKHLWPGQFVNVRLTLQTLPGAVVMPASAVNQGPKGPYAYVVGADHKAVLRPVSVLATQDAMAVIKSGVKPGETVVTDGQMSLKPGSLVQVRVPGARKPGA